MIFSVRASCVLNSCVVLSLTLLKAGNQVEDKTRPGWPKMVSSNWFSGVWRNIAEQQLSVRSCSHFIIKILCDDNSSKTKDTASQSTGYTYIILYIMSFLIPVQKHFSCPTAWIKFYFLVFKLYEYSETSVASESSHTPVGSNESRQSGIHDSLLRFGEYLTESMLNHNDCYSLSSLSPIMWGGM